MGASKSYLSNEQIDEYVQLTYLTKSEIIYIFDKFSQLNLNFIKQDFNYRFAKTRILEIWPEFKYNPFCDRIFKIFSSFDDNKFSFEDFLNLCSALSAQCPLEVKATWAFKMFDYDGDDILTKDDIAEVIDRLTEPFQLFSIEKEHIITILLKEMDLQNKGGMSQLEFVHAMSKMPEFAEVFSFRV